MKLAAGIVLYNPDLKKLDKSLKELNNIADVIILVDNCSRNIEKIRDMVDKDAILLENAENLGIAVALNMLVDSANSKKCDFLLTLDQDSIMPRDALNKMIECASKKDVAIVCPMIVDVNKKEPAVYKEDLEEIDRCITSGSLMNLRICNKIGRFDEKMFIDYVDFDYCKRIRLAGYKIVRVNSAKLIHELGKRTERKFLWKTVYPTNHKPERVYYYARNIYYYLRKYKKNLSFGEKVWEHVTILWKAIAIILYEDDKIEKISSFLDGKKDSKKMLMEGA